MEEPLNIDRDVVKNGVRLDCVFEGYEYRPEREEVRSQRLAGFECVEIAENTGLSLEQVTDYCRELGLPETGSCQLQPPDGSRERHCPVCGRILVQRGNSGRRRFCSPECRKEYYRQHKSFRIAVCKNCGREFHAVDEGKRQRKFCSLNCYWDYRYSGTASRGMGAEAIRKKMESINPDKFKIRKFGVSDVIGLTAAGKTSFFYVDKDRLVRFNGFFPKPQSGTYLILDEGGYQVAGQKGTWLVSDEVEVDGQRFVQMRSEQTKNPPPSIILHESGAFVTQTALGFDGEAIRKMRAFLQGPKPELLHHQKFFENGTAERAKESGTEQNYNMIDGCVNNVPKKPRRIGGRWSVLDRLHIKQAERRQKDNTPQQEQERSRKS